MEPAPTAPPAAVTQPETTPDAPSWLADAHRWVAERLLELGIRPLAPIAPVRVRPWSTVLSVETDRGRVFFKANEPAHRYEAALASHLARRRPDVVPPPLAIEPATGWMLMSDAGAQLRGLVERERDVTRWLAVLATYARLQAGMAADAEELIAIGTPDLRLAALPARFASAIDDLARLDDGSHTAQLAGLRDALPRVAEQAHELAALGIPETIEHDDLNDGAVYLGGTGYRIIDWGDACVSHPFFSLSVALEGVIAWGPDDVEGSVDITPYREAYLAAYAAALPDARPIHELRAGCDLALRLGWVCRAVNGHEHGDDTASTWTRLRMAFEGGVRRGQLGAEPL